MSYRIIIPATENELKAYYQLRFEVLRKAWGQPENTTRDEWEDLSIHAMMIDDDGKTIATGRLQLNPEREGQIRSMAVAKEYRGKNLGTEMLKYLEQKAVEKKLIHIILDARDNALNFYLKNGYIVEGNSYTLFNVIPHFRMKKILPADK